MPRTTFVFTDIEGSTKLLTELGPRYATLLSRHHETIRSCIKAHGGTELGTEGDSFSIRFDSPSAALAAAIDIQRRLADSSSGPATGVKVRVGIHTGDVLETEAGLVGLALHETARLTAAGHGGQILLSDITAALVRGAMPDGVTLNDLGPHLLKDLAEPRRLFQVCHPELRSDFPSLRSLSTLPNNLPRQASRFIGRDDDIRTLQEALEESRSVTLVGPGGTGKTRLALQVAAASLVRYPGGAWFVDLAAVTSADAVPAAIATAVEVRLAPARPPLDIVAEALSESPTLLVLDNCEHVIDACADAEDRLLRDTATVNVLATSREPLNVAGEKVWPVGPLSLPPPDEDADVDASRYEAVELFRERALMKNPDLVWDRSTQAYVVDICRRLDGIPLAIELAAAKTSWLSPQQIAERLDDRFALLTDGNRVALPRQRTLRSLIEWSYDLLDDSERALFAELAVFRGSFDLEAVTAVCDTGGSRCEDVLGALVSKSLVTRIPGTEPPRFRLLETIHAYAEEKLDASGRRNELRHRHLEHAARVAERADTGLKGPEQRRWMNRIAADEPNVVAAFDWAIETRDAEKTASILPGLAHYWNEAGKWRDAQRLLDRAVPLLDLASRPSATKAFSAAAIIHAHLLSVETGRDLAERAMRIARDLQDGCLEARALTAWATTYLFEGNIERAAAIQADALAVARQAACREMMPHLLYNHAFALVLLRNAPEADALLAESKRVAESQDDWSIAAAATMLLAMDAVDAGDGRRGLSLSLDALQIFESVGNRLRVLYAVEIVAGAYALLGEPLLAARLFGASEAIRRRGGIIRAPALQERFDQRVRVARSGCAPAEFAAAWQEGSELTLERAVALAR